MLDTNRIQIDQQQGNTPVWCGEWSLATQFDASDDFLKQWADAQKLAWSQSMGWIVSLYPCRPRRFVLTDSDGLVLEFPDRRRQF